MEERLTEEGWALGGIVRKEAGGWWVWKIGRVGEWDKEKIKLDKKLQTMSHGGMKLHSESWEREIV